MWSEEAIDFGIKIVKDRKEFCEQRNSKKGKVEKWYVKLYKDQNGQ